MPLQNLYGKYTDPYRLVEFRMFLLNLCNMGCRGCFYKRDGNTFGTYEPALTLSQELQQHGYSLETCYLLPTDIFENESNKDLFRSEEFAELARRFRYVGIASTLIGEWDKDVFDLIERNGSKVELQVNIVLNHLFETTYETMLREKIQQIVQVYPSTVINLAVNVGVKFSPEEIVRLHELVDRLSADKIVEVNFTFLYNSLIGPTKRQKMMLESYKLLREFSDLYVKDGDPRFNSRTMLRKPAFTFKDGKIYVSPIMPFDEYVFLHKYALEQASFDGFLSAYSIMEADNHPIIDACDSCPNLSTCHGKGFFALAREMGLPCYLEENMNADRRN